MQQKIFVLIVNPDLNEECVRSRKDLDELLGQGWRIVQATPILVQGEYIYNNVTNSIVYVIEK